MGRFRQRARSIATVALIGGFIGGTAAVLTGAGPASAQSTSVSIVAPSNGAKLSGVEGFDAVPNAMNGKDDSGVQFFLVGTGYCTPVDPCLVGNATLSWIGWVIQWDTDRVPNGTYSLIATVFPNNARTNISVTVSNPVPTVVYPAPNSTVSGLQYLDCVPPRGVNQVQFWLTGGALTSPQLVSDGVLTWVGWLGAWSTSGVANGSYSLYCSGTYPQPDAGIGQGPSIPVVVSN
jgi:hypothetical protein